MPCVATTKQLEKRQPRLPLLEPGHSLARKYYLRSCPAGESLLGEPAAYQRARMRYLRTDVPSLATGTMNCAANAAVFVYL